MRRSASLAKNAKPSFFGAIRYRRLTGWPVLACYYFGRFDLAKKAIEWARQLPDAEWELQPFDHAAYQPHAEAMIAQDELPESEAVEDALRENETRYVLLKGDCETGEGDVILQPWIETQEPDLLASDLCADWIGALKQLGLTHLSERLDDLAGGSLPAASDRILFDARSRKRRDK